MMCLRCPTASALAALLVLLPILALASTEATVLPDNIIVHGRTFFENTARAVPPTRGCPFGSLVVNPGQPRSTTRLLRRPLLDRRGRVDWLSPTEEIAFPLLPGQALATDNQLVRLKDGSLLAARDAYFWTEMSPRPAWAEERVSGSGDHLGQRGGVILFRSTDGGKSWTERSALDMGTAAGGKFGVPRPMSDAGGADVPAVQQGHHPDGKPKWWVGGCDRTEVYACPFTGAVYLTTRVISGPYGSDGRQYNTLLLFRSRDAGLTWEALKEDLPAWSPMVMTSTPDGRLFLLQVIGSQPTLYWSNEPNAGDGKVTISAGHAVYATEEGARIPSEGGLSVDLFFQCAHPSISRLAGPGPDRVRVAYQARNAAGMQEARVVCVELGDPGKEPTVSPITTVRADDPNNYSAMYFAFIDPDYVDMPAGARPSTSVLYWIEAPRKGLAERRYRVRYSVLDDEGGCSPPRYLSVEGGRPRTWSRNVALGDYMTGGFYWHHGTLNYVTQWVEPQGLVANVVTIPYTIGRAR